MRKPGKLEAFLLAVFLIFFGVRGILTGEVPAFQGKGNTVPSTTLVSPLVPWIGLILVIAGLYVLVRFFILKRR